MHVLEHQQRQQRHQQDIPNAHICRQLESPIPRCRRCRRCLARRKTHLFGSVCEPTDTCTTYVYICMHTTTHTALCSGPMWSERGPCAVAHAASNEGEKISVLTVRVCAWDDVYCAKNNNSSNNNNKSNTHIITNTLFWVLWRSAVRKNYPALWNTHIFKHISFVCVVRAYAAGISWMPVPGCRRLFFPSSTETSVRRNCNKLWTLLFDAFVVKHIFHHWKS